jgi:hypothetical protein
MIFMADTKYILSFKNKFGAGAGDTLNDVFLFW